MIIIASKRWRAYKYACAMEKHESHLASHCESGSYLHAFHMGRASGFSSMATAILLGDLPLPQLTLQDVDLFG